MDLTWVNLDKNILNIIACGVHQVFMLHGLAILAECRIKLG